MSDKSKSRQKQANRKPSPAISCANRRIPPSTHTASSTAPGF
jgi:hypothetical protein